MKTLRLFAFLFAAAAMVTFSSCNKDEDDNVTVIDFESIELPEAGYLNDTILTLEGVTFYNNFTDWGGGSTFWYGFIYSNCIDKTTPGYKNDFSVYGDGGYKSKQFAVLYYASFEDAVTPYFQFTNKEEKLVQSAMITNGTYTVLAITEGKDAPAKKFEAGDWFKVIFTGYNAAGEETGEVEFYLADFRNGKSYICTSWTEVNLELLGRVNKVTVTFESTDNGEHGMNTPAYVCLDNLAYWNE